MQQGTLRIVPTILPRLPEIGRLAMNKDRVVNICRNEEDCVKSAQWFGNRLVLCVITCIAPIEFHDMVFDTENNFWVAATRTILKEIERNPTRYEKLLVDDDEVSPETLLLIVNREISHGDEVLVDKVGDKFVVSPVKSKKLKA